MNRIALYFYSCTNLGDDLFVKTFSDFFRDCRIDLITNPRCMPTSLGDNVKMHPYSVLNLVFGKFQSVFGEGSKISSVIQKCNDYCFRKIREHSDAYVYIGGSVFMQHTIECEALDFSVSNTPQFEFSGKIQDRGNSFVIGANLGPVYTEAYWPDIRERLMAFTHVCLRDYASYSHVKDLQHVQYAPDVLFMVPKPDLPPKGENVVISVVDMARHTTDPAIISAYYQLLADAVGRFSSRGIPVTLVSFCDYEGDSAAIDRILSMVPDSVGVKKLCYEGDIQEILDAFAQAAYVVGSRFHSVILAISFGKPVYPIAYNCKTEHYLQDLKFGGKYADLKNMTGVNVDDLFYNYENHIITDCKEHKKYAKNQFRALQQYLQLEDREILVG